MKTLPVISLTVLLMVLVARTAFAQTAMPSPPRFEPAAGAQFVGSSSLGSREANLTTAAGGTLRLFTTSSTLRPAAGFEGRLGIRVSRQLDVEAFGAYAKPALRTRITNDLESAGTTDANETVKQYVVGGSALWYLSRKNESALRLFVMGGAAFLRQLHNDDTYAVNGRQFEFGAGVKVPLATTRSKRGNHLRVFGIRADGRVQVRVDGATFDGDAHYGPALSAMAFIRF
jgi:hypothetical protein